jgi:hypothetical protein
MIGVKKAARTAVYCFLLVLNAVFLAVYHARISSSFSARWTVAAPLSFFHFFIAIPLLYLLIAMLTTEIVCTVVRRIDLSRRSSSPKSWYFCLMAFAVLILLYVVVITVQMTGGSNSFFLKLLVFIISTPQLFAFPGILLALSLFMLSEKAE